MLQPVIKEASWYGMNTHIICRVIGEEGKKAVLEAEREIVRLEEKLSRFLPDSEISKINLYAGLGTIKVSAETYEVLLFAKRLSEMTKGLFDITIAPLVDLWKYNHFSDIPSRIEIEKTMNKISYEDLMLHHFHRSAGLRRSGQSIDLGGIGKGYASERCISIFKRLGVASAYINIGGNVSTLGNKPDGSPWSVGIRHPRCDDRLIGAVRVTGKAVVTSGDYERCFIDRNGNRWHHILNPTTGYPACSGLFSVTVVAKNAVIADALSTALFVAGSKHGLGYLSKFPGTEAILVDDHLKVTITQGLKDCFQPADGMNVSIL